jgi:AraC-like DNA-binding protein
MKHDMNSRFVEVWFEDLLAHDVRVEIFSRTRVGEGWGYRNRTLDEHLLYWILDGKMAAEWDGLNEELSAGDVLWIAPGRSHTFTLLSQEMDVVHIRFNPYPDSLPISGDHITSQGYPTGQAKLLDLLMEWRQELPARQSLFKADLSSFLISLLRSLPDSEKGLGVSRRRKVMEALDSTPPKEWKSSLLARHLGLSTVHFSRLFVATFGEKPRSWLVREKMRRMADELTESRDTIARVAARWGYEDPFLFSRQFKGVFGESPKHWRARH